MFHDPLNNPASLLVSLVPEKRNLSLATSQIGKLLKGMILRTKSLKCGGHKHNTYA